MLAMARKLLRLAPMMRLSVTAALLATLVPAVAAADPPRARVVHRPAPVYVAPRVHVHHHPTYVPGYYAPGYYAPAPAVTSTYVGPSTWYMGLGIVGTSILEQSGGPEELEGGGGLSLWAGLHLNRVLSLEVGWL